METFENSACPPQERKNGADKKLNQKGSSCGVSTPGNEPNARGIGAVSGSGAMLEERADPLGKNDLQTSSLEAENSRLREQLKAILQDRGDGETYLHEQRPNSADLLGWKPLSLSNQSDIQSQVSRKDYETLSHKYAALLLGYDALQTRYAQREKKYKMAKDVVKQWRAYLDRIPESKKSELVVSSSSSTVKPTEETKDLQSVIQVPTSPTKIASAREPRSRSRTVGNSNKPIEVIPRIPSSPPQPKEPPDQISEVVRHHRPDRQVTSSQTTVDDTQSKAVAMVPVKQEAMSDEEPTVVSSRSLKRRGSASAHLGLSSRRIKREPDCGQTTVEINSEDYSSPPVHQKHVFRTESSDLNVIESSVITPRKAKSFGYVPQHTPRRESNEAPSATKSDTAGRISGTRLPANYSQSTRNNKRAGVEGTAYQIGSPYPSSRILQPLSANMRTRSHKGASSTSAKSKPKSTNPDREVAVLAEDGDYTDDQGFGPGQRDKNGVNEQLLEGLLNSNSTKRIRQTAVPIPNSAHKTRLTAEKTARASPTNGRSRNNLPSGLEDPPPDINPEDEPLRLRPVSSLHLEDFKINPKYLGSDFAFADTLRGRDQRRGLHTCSKPDCCGGIFLKAVELGGSAISGKSDSQALEEYLGAYWAEIMGSYGLKERKEVVKRAHAHVIANQHGKHRHAFERHSTPPGFWRVDMPSTQEAEEDRERARDMEKQKVEERRREAMRKGGRWLFRDERP